MSGSERLLRKNTTNLSSTEYLRLRGARETRF